jgi:hypothetical protein
MLENKDNPGDLIDIGQVGDHPDRPEPDLLPRQGDFIP